MRNKQDKIFDNTFDAPELGSGGKISFDLDSSVKGNLSEEEISKRIKELSLKVAIARRGRNPDMLQKLQHALQTYQDAIIDTVTYNSQQMYSKQYFDLFLNQGLGKTVFTKQQAVDRGIFTGLQKIQSRGIDPFFESKL